MSSLFFTASCGEPNLLTEFSKTDSDDALFLEAEKRLDEMKWNEALDILENQLSVAYRTQDKVQDMRASAYAGKCGLTFFSIIANLGSSDASTPFNFFLGSMRNKIVSPGDCDQALAIITGTHGDFSQRTQQQNFNMAILGMATAGAYLRADLDQDNAGLGDGVLDAGKDICDNTDFDNSNVDGAIIGFGVLVENLAAVAGDLAGATVTEIQNFKTLCDSIMGTCDLTDTAFVAAHRTELRGLLNHNSVGVGSCNSNPFILCCGP